MNIEKTMRTVMLVLTAFTLGLFVNFKFYHVEGLWGSQNALKHVERVELPKAAKTAVAASEACQRNMVVASATSDLDNTVGCPEPSKELLKAAAK